MTYFKRIALSLCLTATGMATPERSGSIWCSRYPGSISLLKLTAPFNSNVRDFIDSLREAGANVVVFSTKRPEQRQYLMHWAWMIKREDFWLETSRPCSGPPGGRKLWVYPLVPPYSGDITDGSVDIIWLWLSGPEFPVTLRNCSGAPDGHYHTGQHGDALVAAAAMIDGYRLIFRPARTSRHNMGTAIDMAIQWSGDLTVAQKDGSMQTISSVPRNCNNVELQKIGASYGVFKLVSDFTHWSKDGH